MEFKFKDLKENKTNPFNSSAYCIWRDGTNLSPYQGNSNGISSMDCCKTHFLALLFLKLSMKLFIL